LKFYNFIFYRKRRRRRGTLLKGLAGGAAAGLGAALLYKAFKKKN